MAIPARAAAHAYMRGVKCLGFSLNRHFRQAVYWASIARGVSYTRPMKVEARIPARVTANSGLNWNMWYVAAEA